MTSKFVGRFELCQDQTGENTFKLVKDDCPVPPKNEWHNYSVWEFNGRRYRPITELAKGGLDELVSQFARLGYTKAVKDGRRKPTSVKYAVCTFGVEDFRIVK